MERKAVPDNTAIHSAVTKGYESVAKVSADGSHTLSVLVSGAYCAACIYNIESSVRKDPCVTHARLNFSTGQLSISWTGAPAAANDFVSNVENLGYGVRPYDSGEEKKQMENEERFLLLCLGVAGFAMGNIMLVSVGLWTTSADTMGMATRDFMHWISAFIALPTIIFSGRPFFRSAHAALTHGHTNMDVPISVGLILAGGMSLFETISHGEHAYFDSAVMLIFFLLIGRYFDFRARKRARSSATELLSSLSGFATVIEDGKARHILIRDLCVGQIVRVSVGETFPADGVVTEGISDVDVSIVTGETMPVTASRDAHVYAGTVNISAPLTMRVIKTSEDSLLADIARLMDKAEQGQARYVRLADMVARLYTPVVHTLAVIAFVVWFFVIGVTWQQALMTAITVLIITCPCALGLAVPIVQVLATDKLMRQGILVKSGDALERLSAIDTIVMDKTGTLTRGKPVLAGLQDAEHLRLAASLAVHSRHPLSQAISRSYDGALLSLEHVREYSGCGMEGWYNGTRVRLGSRGWCGVRTPRETNALELWLEHGNAKKIVFLFEDRLRDDSAATLQKFHKDGFAPILLSGDCNENVQKTAHHCGIAEYYGEQSPSQKFSFMEILKSRGHKVLMVGDGLNDAPTLAAADISMAPGTAISITQNAADIVFMGDRLEPVYLAYKTACLTQKIVKQNFGLSIAYNIVAIPVAALGLLTPALAALAMSGSSLMVIINSFRVRRSQ